MERERQGSRSSGSYCIGPGKSEFKPGSRSDDGKEEIALKDI